MKKFQKWLCGILSFLLMLGMAGAHPAEAASLIRSVNTSYDYFTEPDDVETYGGYWLFASRSSGVLYRTNAKGKNEKCIVDNNYKKINAVANDTTVIYSSFNKNVLTIWKENIKTLSKSKAAEISVSAYEASICGFYNNIVYYWAISKQGESLMFSYSLSTKKSTKMGTGVHPYMQMSGYIIYGREKLDGSDGMILKCYNAKTKKGTTIDNAVEYAKRIGKYLYFAAYGRNRFEVDGVKQWFSTFKVVKYDLDTKESKTLLEIPRRGTSVKHITSKGVYYLALTEDGESKDFYTDYQTKQTKNGSPNAGTWYYYY